VLGLADVVRRRLHGDLAYYNVNRHFNYSNVCALSCKFCDVSTASAARTARTSSGRRCAAAGTQGPRGRRDRDPLVGGLHPYLPFSYYTDLLSAMRSEYPQLHIKAFTAVEIVHLARIDGARPNDGSKACWPT
jgi:aminodeoxyfutalosine synthase